MADDTNTAEREAIIRAAVAAMPHTNPLVADDLLGGFTMHTEADDIVAIFQAGRASLAASAGSEPVAWRDPSNMCDDQSFTLSRERAKKWPHIYKQPLYTHHSPPEGMAGLPTRNELALQLLVAGGFVTEKKLAEALALVDAACPALSPPLPASEAKEL